MRRKGVNYRGAKKEKRKEEGFRTEEVGPKKKKKKSRVIYGGEEGREREYGAHEANGPAYAPSGSCDTYIIKMKLESP